MSNLTLERPRALSEPSVTGWMVLLAPVALVASTYPVFQLAKLLLDDAVGGQLAWFVGMSFYWLAWGAAFSLWILGPRRVWELARPRRATPGLVSLVAFLVVMAVAVRFLVPGMGYPDATAGALALLVISTFANGFFEELFWRGVFYQTFRHSRLLRVIWPSIWFGLWHLVPGSISAGGIGVGMVIGPVFMGLYLAYLTTRTGTIWWAILAHAIGGLVMIS